MYCRWVLIFVLSIIFAVQTHAETFTVTSNADSGPGTLREALTKAAANGDVEKDFIYFNLPDVSEAGRTIKINQALPNVSSNLEVNATTQPGLKFGVSDTKVKLIGLKDLERFGTTTFLFMAQQKDISIFGLFIEHSKELNNTNNALTTGITINSCVRITIGAPGKGNIINNFDQPIACYWESGTVARMSTENLIIQSNIININEDGQSAAAQKQTITYLSGVRNLTFGGKTPAEGNIVCGFVWFVEDSDLIELGDMLISNNKFGVNSEGTDVLKNNSSELPSGITASVIYNYKLKSCEISYNQISDAISVGLNNFFVIKGNKMGVDVTGKKLLNHKGFGITIAYCTGGGLIGGPGINDGNILAGTNYSDEATKDLFGVIYNAESPRVEVTGNIIKCNNGLIPYKIYALENHTPVITARTNDAVKGTAEPNSRIDLYYSLECDYCEPQQFFASVNTNADGIWEYNGPVANHAVIASATLNGATSEFTSLKFINKPEEIMIGMACKEQNGFIKGLKSNSALTYAWYNEKGNVVSNALDLTNVGAGKYYLLIGDGYCNIKSPIYEIKGSAIINTSGKVITQNTCNQATGSITGITATGTGTLTYSWRNAQDTEVGTSLNLTNQSAGIYKLKVTDESACGPVYSEPIEITSLNGVQLVTTNVSVRSSTCGLANGYIRGLQAPGASTFIWTRDDGSVAGNTLDLENIPAGNYRLTISNTTCANYADFRIDAVTPTIYPQFAATITKTCAAFPTGTISINTDGAQDQPGIFRWVDSQNNTAGYGKTIQYLPAGTYKLYLTDAGSCESFYKEYTVDAYPELTIAFGNAHDIYCGVGKGSIDAAIVSGGTGNYFYEWKDGNGNVIPGKTQAFINDIDAGTYTLSITDGGCNLAMLTYTIKEQTQIIPAPLIADIEVTRTGNTTLQVTDPFPTAIYRLYNSETGSTPLAESQGGSFTVNVTGNRSYYIGLSYGECESPRTRVRVVLTILNVNIPNTFTPNGDGFNDYWAITGIEESKIATVKIFGRSGQMVFQSVGYPKPFDGTQNGKQLPAGTYYYIIEQKNVKPFSGYVTILR